MRFNSRVLWLPNCASRGSHQHDAWQGKLDSVLTVKSNAALRGRQSKPPKPGDLRHWPSGINRKSAIVCQSTCEMYGDLSFYNTVFFLINMRLPEENTLRHGCKLTWSISKILLWDELSNSCVVLPQSKTNENLSLWNLCFRDQVIPEIFCGQRGHGPDEISFINWGRSSCVAKQGGRSLRRREICWWNGKHLGRTRLLGIRLVEAHQLSTWHLQLDVT